MQSDWLFLDRRQRLIKVPQTPARGDPLDRHAAEIAAQLGQNFVLELVERGEVDMAAFSLDHLIIVVFAEQSRDSETRAGADNADHPFIRKRQVGATDPPEILIGQRRHCISHRAEVVDDRKPVDP